MKQREGPILVVLLNNFKYTTEKVAAFRNRALSPDKIPYLWFTPFAETIYRSNLKLMKKEHIVSNVGEKWNVEEHDILFEVDTIDMSNITCSCRRFFDEEVPCQHILSVMYSKARINQSTSLISKCMKRTDSKELSQMN